MTSLSFYSQGLLYLSAVFTLFVFYKAGYSHFKVIMALIFWMNLHGVLAFNHFYENTDLPPRFALVILPAVAVILFIFNYGPGRHWIDSLNLKWLTIIHVVRVPVELMLYELYTKGAVPELMTFSGRNFDILAGITAPIVYYLFFVKKGLSRRSMLIWNVICLLLVINIAVQAVLSAPLPFQQFGFEQPNVAVMQFPFVWLPALIVPLVIFAHIVAIRRLAGS